jgi:hypothetical protein
MGKTSIFSILQKFLIFLDDGGVTSSNKITNGIIIEFLSSYSGNSTRSIANVISTYPYYQPIFPGISLRVMFA